MKREVPLFEIKDISAQVSQAQKIASPEGTVDQCGCRCGGCRHAAPPQERPRESR